MGSLLGHLEAREESARGGRGTSAGPEPAGFTAEGHNGVNAGIAYFEV